MAANFDPYYKWFGIRPEDQPPDFYRLLGIAAFETDLDVISSAADQRMNHLRTMQNGPHAIASQRVLNEVSKARVTLFDADRKLNYDVTLRKKIAAAAAAKRASATTSSAFGPATRAASGPSDVEPLDKLSGEDSLDMLAVSDLDAALGAAPTAGSTASLTRNRRGTGGSRAAPMWIAAAVGGSVALVVAVVALARFAGVDPLGLFPPSDIVAEDDDNRQVTDAPQVAPGDADPSTTAKLSPDVKKNGGEKRPIARSDANAIRTNAAAGTATDVNNSAADGTNAIPIDPFENLPLYAALPAATDTTAHTLVALHGSPSPVVDALTLLADAAALGEGQSFAVVANEYPPAQRWQVRLLSDAPSAATPAATSPTAALADVWIAGGAVQFQWRESAASIPTAGQLQNCLLQLRAAGKQANLPLRAPVTAAALVLDLSTAADLVEIPVDAPPKADKLVLEIGPIDALPREATFANDRRRVRFTSPTREKVVLALDMLDDENRPLLSIEPQALRTGLHLRVAPRIVGAKDSFPLSLSQVADIRKNYGVRKIRTDKQWKELQQHRATMRKQIENIDKQLLTFPPQRVLLQREQVRLTALLAEADAAFEKIDADKTEIDKMLDTMPAVEELIGELHKKAKVPYRVFAEVEVSQGKTIEIDIVRTTE
ncbi:MAG: hypothetical protein WD875_05360 [Pirellulales bacterium]